MGWTDNGKIMPPWITLSEQRETESEGGERKTGEGGMQVQRAGQVEKLCSKSFKVHDTGRGRGDVESGRDGKREGYRSERGRGK